MAYPLTFPNVGTLVSWGSSNFYSSLVAAFKGSGVQYGVTADAAETTGDEASWTGLPGLKTIAGTLSGYAFATPRHGNALRVTFSAGGYALWLNSFSLNLATAAGPHDITQQSTGEGTPPQWTSWMPDYIGGTVTFDCKVDSATALAELPDTGATLPTLTLRYGTDTADNTIAGSAIITGRNVNVQRGQPQSVTYTARYTGAITPAGTNSIFGTTAFDKPLWDEGGANSTTMTINHGTGLSIAGEAFWTSIQLQASLRQAVSLQLGWQGTGEWGAPS